MLYILVNVYMLCTLTEVACGFKGFSLSVSRRRCGDRPDWFPHIPNFTMVPAHSESCQRFPQISKIPTGFPRLPFWVTFLKLPFTPPPC